MTVNFYFEELGALFPLTPALSLGEREKRSQLPGEATAGCCPMIFEFYKNAQRLFLLPQGEGQGENSPNPSSRFETLNRSAAVSQTSRSSWARAATGFQHSRAPVHGEGKDERIPLGEMATVLRSLLKIYEAAQ